MTSPEVDYVTDADIKAQDLIIKGIRHFWPSLKIIGEEESTPSSPWPFEPSELNPNLLLANHFANHNEIPVADSVVWIDPLDGTLSFLKGELDCVTTLIGVSVNNKPTIGIIGQPFQAQSCQFLYSPKIYYSLCPLSTIYYNYQSDLSSFPIIPYQLQRPDVPPGRFVVTSSCNRQTEELKGYLEGFGPTGQVRIGGAGNKILQIVKGNVDVYFSHRPNSLKKWDTCAGEVLLNCFGGQNTDLNGKAYNYGSDTSLGNENGNLASLNPTLHSQVLHTWNTKLKPQ